MTINQESLKKYAKLSVATGINIQKGQILVIKSPVACAEFTRLIVDEAYILGAKEVVVHWSDETVNKLKYTYCDNEVLAEYPDWMKESMLYYAKKGAAFLSISASDPDLLKDIDAKKVAISHKAQSLATKEFSSRLMTNKNAWSIIALPTDAWAKKVFPHLSVEKAVIKLWNEIFKIVRVDTDDPVKAWDDHKDTLRKKLQYLNSKNFKSLHFKNSEGTDLRVELVDNHIWAGGSEFTEDGIEFIANMPTEEVFSMPKANGVDGTVVSSKPLNYNGSLIDGFKLTFKNGKVVDYSAETGYESLKAMLETDEGAKSLGEVALVPFDSPISNSNTIFYNTLYDENASCHLALGRAYSICIKDGDKLTDEEKSSLGYNDSLIHVDFMIGTSDLSITGVTQDGKLEPVFINGNWA